MWDFVPFSPLWTTENSRALPPLHPDVFGSSLKHSQLLWEAGFSLCCWDALPSALCLLSDPSRPGFVLVVPLLPGLRLGCPASSLGDDAPQLKAGPFLVLGSVRAFLRT